MRRGTEVGASIDIPDLRQGDPVMSSAAPVELPSIAFGGPVLLTGSLEREGHSLFCFVDWLKRGCAAGQAPVPTQCSLISA
jgi:hypothetical protein